MNVFFSVNEFDRDGDLVEEGVYLHFGDTKVKVAEDLKGYKDFVTELQRMDKEISEVFST
jgi:hypothetical protein